MSTFTKENVKAIFPLSPLQSGILFHSLMNQDQGEYFEQLSFKVLGSLEIALLKKSYLELVKRHEILRTVFIYEGVKQPVQAVLHQIESEFYLQDLTSIKSEAQTKTCDEFKVADRKRGFDFAKDFLARLSILKLSAMEHLVVFSFHHILMDGWSLGIIIKELFQIYHALVTGNASNLLAIGSYQKYLQWQSQQDLTAAQDYWCKYLAGYEQKATALNTQTVLKMNAEPQSKRLMLEGELYQKIFQVTRELGVTINAFVQSVWGLLLQRYNNTEEVVFGIVVSGRTTLYAGLENMTGLFINTIPLKFRTTGDLNYDTLVKQLQYQILKGEEYSALPLYEIQQFSSLKQDLFESIVIFENYPLDQNLFSVAGGKSEALTFTEIDFYEKTNYPLNLQVIPHKNALEIRIIYNPDVYNAATVQKISGHFQVLASGIVADPSAQVAQLEILTVAEKDELLKKFNATHTDYDRETTIDREFLRQVQATPEAMALIFQEESLTYEELNQLAETIADQVRNLTKGEHQIIGLLCQRSVPMIAGILGILKAGSAYLPLDSDYPSERIDYMLKDSKTTTVLTFGCEKIELLNRNVKVVDLAEILTKKRPSKKFQSYSTPKSAAYIIYTSGSTGNPKGVIISHQAVLNFIAGIKTKLDFSQDKKILCLTTISFDIFVLETLLPLTTGVTVVLANETEQVEAAALNQLLLKNQLQMMQATPSRLRMLLGSGENLTGLAGLTEIMVGGEAFPSILFEELRKVTTAWIYNMYGPTETTIWSSLKKIDSENEITIGKPLTNTQMYVVGTQGSLQPVGAVGELWIGGEGLSDGYLGLPELTKERFVKSSFLSGEILYRTGDLARWKVDGELECLGRTDAQVKLRGYRIELGEIEACLLKYEEINEVAVVVWEDLSSYKYLAAYYTGKTELENESLRRHLAKSLPEYMIPSLYLRLSEMPLTPNGKINRKALPKPENVGVVADFQAPTGEVELKLAVIWSELLKLHQVSANSGFIELGGHSILMMQAVARINRELGIKISLKELLETGNLRKLALLIDEKKSESQLNLIQTKKTELGKLHEPFQLTPIQSAYLVGRSTDYELGGVGTHVYGEFEVPYTVEKIQEALQKLITRHSMLRAVINEEGKEQILTEVPRYQIEVIDVRAWSLLERAEQIKKLREEMEHHIFQINTWPLFDFKALKDSDDQTYLLVGFDMLIADAGSMQIIFSELAQYCQNETLFLPELDFTFRDYVETLNTLTTTNSYQQAKKYWLAKLNEFPTAPNLPLLMEPSKIIKPSFKRLHHLVKSNDWERLQKLAREKGITPSALLCTAYAEVLAYWSNQPHLALNLTVFNRYPFHEMVNSLVGDFTSVMMLDLDLAAESDFWKKAVLVQEKIMEALEYRDYDGVYFIGELLKTRNLTNQAIAPVVFTSALTGEHHGLSRLGRMKYALTETSQVYLDSQVLEENGALYLAWDYVIQIFDPLTIETMFDQYLCRIKGLINGQNSSLALTITDLNLWRSYNQTEIFLPVQTLHGLFRKQVTNIPTQLAICDGIKSLTYQELELRSNQIANYLIAQGVKRGDLLGVLAERSWRTIANLLGVLKAGAAYVPIDPDYPVERRDYILENSRCQLLLKPTLYEEQGLVTYQAEFGNEINDPEDLAYVIYTSGSTGQPKGVMISHQAAVNTILDINQRFQIGIKDRIPGISSMCFDLSVYDIFGSLSTGATLMIVPDQRDVMQLAEMIKEEKLTIWNSVPAIMEMVVEELEASQKVADVPMKEVESLEYFWSPGSFWKKRDALLYINGNEYPEMISELFPEFYYLAQDGITKEQLLREFPEVSQVELIKIIEKLSQERVLVNSLLGPVELFATQAKLFENKYDEEIPFVAEKAEQFKLEQLRRCMVNNEEKIMLKEPAAFPEMIAGRNTYRSFEQSRKISFDRFSKVLSIFSQYQQGEEIKYLYASGGGLYPIDIYLEVKAERIEDLEHGLYYYNPTENSLTLVNKQEISIDKAHFFTNKDIYRASAFSIYLIYNAVANMPKYGSLGYFLACLDAGIMVGALTQAAELMDLGLCSIGSMNFEMIRSTFKLNQNQVWLHTIEVGLKPDRIYREDELIPVLANKSAAKLVNVLPKQNVGKNLRLIMLSGDWIPLTLPERIKRIFPQVTVVSLGGATEGSIWSIYYPIDGVKSDWKSIPYGMPLANQQFYILNYEMKLCPAGVPGELYIGGAGVALGYHYDLEKTESAFINHSEFGYLYKTGDYGVMHRAGYIEFLGRQDHQVKIKGYRVELGEIANCLLKHPGIKNVVVIDLDDQGKKSLCAYYVSVEEIELHELKETLRSFLPEYMIPAYFVRLDSITLTPNGKVDRKTLVKPEFSSPKTGNYLLPRNEIEARLLTIWQEVLGIETISMDDVFFEIDGDSLKAIRLTGIISREFNLVLRVQDLFKYTTIRRIAELIQPETKKTETVNKFSFSED